jgi:hypothetical protein
MGMTMSVRALPERRVLVPVKYVDCVKVVVRVFCVD